MAMKTTRPSHSFESFPPDDDPGAELAGSTGMGMFLIRVGLLALLGFGAAKSGLGIGATDRMGKTSHPGPARCSG